MEQAASPGLRQRVGNWVESRPVQNFIIVLICFNAITLGLETFDVIQRHAGTALLITERVVLTIFVIEIALKLFAFDYRFFKEGWNVFDFFIVAISLMPDTGPFSVLRALRILRVLRLVAKVGRLRMIVESLLKAIPSIGWIAFLLGLVFYIFGVMGTKLFGESFPEDFGHLGLTLFSLFQVMTLESWSEAIARPVMDEHAGAWLFFVSFILVSAFTVLNLFIGIIVNSMQSLHWEEEEEKRAASEQKAHDEREEMLQHIRQLHDKVDRLEQQLTRDGASNGNGQNPG